MSQLHTRGWDAVTGQVIAGLFPGHTHCVTSGAYSPAEKRIGSGSDDKTVRVWDAVTGQIVAEMSMTKSKSFSPGLVRSCSLLTMLTRPSTSSMDLGSSALSPVLLLLSCSLSVCLDCTCAVSMIFPLFPLPSLVTAMLSESIKYHVVIDNLCYWRFL
jgi:WD40 repeat protein